MDAGFAGCGKLAQVSQKCQGTTLVVPQIDKINAGFSP
jgi:hypothetical protein